MKKLVILCVMGLFLLVGTNAFADVINLGTLTTSPYEYDSTAGTSTDVSLPDTFSSTGEFRFFSF